MGFAQHAFVLAFYFLVLSDKVPASKLYDWAMRQILMLGGDTDTNCAIAGGMIGALIGIKQIDPMKV